MSFTYTWSQPETIAYNSPLSNVSPNVLRPNQSYHQQAPIPLSSYSSLSGALDLTAVTTRPRSYSIYKSKSSTNTSHPYPVSHYDSPQQGRVRTNSQIERGVASSGRSGKRHCREGPVQAPQIPREPKLTGPTNHILVPQREFREECKALSYRDPFFRHSPITFQSTNIPELGVKVSKITERYSPSVVGGNDPVFATISDKEIKFWILWPGYSEPHQKRMKTQSGAITRDIVLMILANALLDFTNMIQKNKIPIEKGYEDWTIGCRADNKQGITGPHLFITRLVHCGGANWQPEIWAPRRP